MTIVQLFFSKDYFPPVTLHHKVNESECKHNYCGVYDKSMIRLDHIPSSLVAVLSNNEI